MDAESLARSGRKVTTESRECACDGGRRYEAGVPTGCWVPCSECGGIGEATVYVYACPTGNTAKTLVRVLAGACAACGASGMDRELVPVPYDHLTFFGGDELCAECAPRHGVL